MYTLEIEECEIVGKCECGAVTVEIEGENYSMKPKDFRRIFGVDRVPRVANKWYSCNYCVNNWGIDLCACGSGNHYKKCREGYKECGKPMQKIGEYAHI